GGILIMEWLIVYGTTWGLLIAVFCEVMVIAYIYGIKQFVHDLKDPRQRCSDLNQEFTGGYAGCYLHQRSC
ncbi:hypothetical protein GCK32_010273, partial [Trichostrongylus colubriformis]